VILAQPSRLILEYDGPMKGTLFPERIHRMDESRGLLPARCEVDKPRGGGGVEGRASARRSELNVHQDFRCPFSGRIRTHRLFSVRTRQNLCVPSQTTIL